MVTQAQLDEIIKPHRYDDRPEATHTHLVLADGRYRFTVVEFVITRGYGDDEPIVMGYRAFEAVGWDDKGEPNQWQDAQANAHPVGTDDLSNAEEYISCSVKLDGCSHWDLGGFHFCGGRSEHYLWFVTLMKEIFEMAERALPESFTDSEKRS